MNSREFIVLHHSADPSQGPQFNKVDRYHKARGFPKSSLGYYVGYHYFIGFDGTVKVARAEWETGAHCNTKMMNYRGIGICLAGDFTLHAPNETQMKSLATLVKEVTQRNKIPVEHILNHRDCKKTACPGSDLARMVIERMNQTTAEDLKFKMESFERMHAIATDPSKQRMAARAIRRISQAISKL